MFVIFSPSDIEEVLRSYLLILIFTPYVYFWSQSGYFDPRAQLQPFLHTWSLELELQFYFTAGITALLVKKYSRKSVAESWLVKICFISFIICVFLAYWKPDANFYLLPFRLWEFVLGGLTAIYANRRTDKTPTLIRLGSLRDIGFSILICAKCLPFSYSSWPGLYTSIPVLGTVLVLIAKKL